MVVLLLLCLVFQQLVSQHTRQLQLSNFRFLSPSQAGTHCLNAVLLQGGDFVGDLDPEVQSAHESHPDMRVDDPHEVGVAADLCDPAVEAVVGQLSQEVLLDHCRENSQLVHFSHLVQLVVVVVTVGQCLLQAVSD